MFPHAIRHFTLGKPSVIRLLEGLAPEPKLVAFIAQRNPRQEAEPAIDELYAVGSSARILNALRVPRDPSPYVVLVEGTLRVRLVGLTQRAPFMKARFEVLRDQAPARSDPEYEALTRSVRDLFSEVITHSPALSNDLLGMVANIEDAAALSDFVAAALPTLSLDTRQTLLETLDVRARLKRLVEELLKERESQNLQKKIQEEIHDKVAGAQREFFLREQLKAIRHELGEEEEGPAELEELRQKIESVVLAPDAKKEALRELGRLKQIPPAAPEYTVARTYLDWLVGLPWSTCTAKPVDLKAAERILDEDHYDLEKVKARILEFLAVYQLKHDLKGPILCFVGPPGVGKTSLGKSIARALGRQFIRISLGGMHDEAEIRGHRRTYVGALPGQIIQGVRRAGARDPVFMLDEVDKLGKDFRGDPASALLEVLDPEQNAAFRDHYLDVPFDLSQVLFVTTANVLDPIPPALLDRMEILELPGYSEEEKLHIARRYLVPRQVEAHGLDAARGVQFTDDGLLEMIRGYTREAGVRNLERAIGTICRKHAREIAGGQAAPLRVTVDTVHAMLGPPRHWVETELEERTRRPGVAVGLAWTPTGGDILFIETARLPRGKGEVVLTGQLGQVMQESARAALSWLRANAARYGLDLDAFKSNDLHIHVPAGAVPKDGPSAGVAMVAALFSLFAEHPIQPFLAMTGEITLSGQVLPVGGIKEKVLAARRSGVRALVLPDRNRADVIEDVPPHLREGMELHYVKTLGEVLSIAFGLGDMEGAWPETVPGREPWVILPPPHP